MMFLFISTLFAQEQTNNTDAKGDAKVARISPEGKVYGVTKSSFTWSEQLPDDIEQVPILDTWDRGESKSDVPVFYVERVSNTPDKIRVKFKVPRFKYDFQKHGTRYNDYVSEREVVDEVTGYKIRTRTVHDIELAWCGADYCLNNSAYLMDTCAEVGPENCDSAYSLVVIDFSKLPRLQNNQAEYFRFSGFQKKIPGKSIGVLIKPEENLTMDEYVVEEKKKLFSPDVYVIRPLTQNEIEKRNKKINQVSKKQMSEILDAKKSNEVKTRYLHVQKNLGKENYTQDGINSKSGLVDVEERTVTKYCFDEMGRVREKKTYLEGTTKKTQLENYNSSSNHSSGWENTYTRSGEYNYSTEYRRIEGSPIERNIESYVSTSECETRKNNLIARESLAGMKGALKNRNGSLVEDQVIKEEE